MTPVSSKALYRVFDLSRLPARNSLHSCVQKNDQVFPVMFYGGVPLLLMPFPHCSYSQNYQSSPEVQSKHHHEEVVLRSFQHSSSGKDQSAHQ